MFMKSKTLVAATALSIAASGAFAQGQEGLVNVSVDDNTVQVPVDVAANVCNIDANVLATDFVGTEDSACTIDQSTAAKNGIKTGKGNSGHMENTASNGKSGKQEGLVNLSLDGNTIQAPVAVAANLCDLDVNLISKKFQGKDKTACEITQEQAAENGLDTSGLSDSDMTDATDTVEDTVDTATDTVTDTVDSATN
ncbi:hypothetical protein [Limimaricola variabilis]|nr:hypothetical protein [Limimaricola variabilis]